MTKLVWLLIMFVFISGCASDYKWYLDKNTSISDALKRYNVWAETLSYKYKDADNPLPKQKSVVIFQYPNDTGYIRSYDKEGSFSMFDYHGPDRINHPLELAQESERVRKNYTHIVTYAEFIK